MKINNKRLFDFIEDTLLVDIHSHPVTGHLRFEYQDYYPSLEPQIWKPFWPVKKDQISVYDTLQASGLNAIYGYSGTDVTDADITELEELSIEFWADGEKVAFNRIMEQSGIEKVFTNTDYPMTRLDKSSVYWVPPIDTFIYPLDPIALKNINPPLRKALIGYYREMLLLASRFNVELKDLDSVLVVIDKLLEEFRKNNAVALKVLCGYIRTLHFGNVDREEAERIYRDGQKSNITDWHEYKKLQDFLARYIFLKAGKMDFPIHFHTGFGAQATLKNINSSPLNLESVLSDTKFVNTKFLILHGGFPFCNLIKPLLEKRNVYTDFSAINYMLFDEELSNILCDWLTYPGLTEKIMFGSDAGAPVYYWIAAKNSRTSIYKALSKLIDRKIIDENKAITIAGKLMRGNAIRFHNLD